MVLELGRLVYDVDVKEVGDNKKVLNNRIATKVTKNKDTFVDIVAWDTTAEFIDKHYKKGFEILIQGRLINSKKKKDNTEYETVAILVDKVIPTYGNPREANLNDIPDFL